ncbi:hypothetical protein DPMN_143811 [Dreissena polymorpha]|uniref:Uncharacterized protein n=1 Tax=Dreissena polymorpha TaxID=45954 RepID=A0A9D4GDR1_DREPO|nr:hypothetical protein DPMN_143811 [Dreissena polymorpha]
MSLPVAVQAMVQFLLSPYLDFLVFISTSLRSVILPGDRSMFSFGGRFSANNGSWMANLWKLSSNTSYSISAEI